MLQTWILVANGRRARFFQYDRVAGECVELAGFIYPAAATLTHATAVAQPVAAEKANSRFARRLADYLNKAIDNRRCDCVALIATDPMLEVLRRMLSPVATRQLLASVGSDFTRYQGRELQQRVQEALRPLV
jgi:protein required for attachment to host cells